MSETIPLRVGRIASRTTINLSRIVTRHNIAIQAAKRTPDIERVIECVCETFNVERQHLMARDRHEYVAWPRQVAMALAHETTGRAMGWVAEYFGGRDHGTVLHAVRAVRDRCETSERKAALVNSLRNRLTQ